MSGYSEAGLFTGERYSLLLAVLATAMVSGFQELFAAAVILLDHRLIPADQAGDGAYTFASRVAECDLLAFSEGEHSSFLHEQPL